MFEKFARLLILSVNKKRARRQSQRGLQIERLEEKALMTVWEPVGEFIVRSDASPAVSGLVAGQMIKIDATFVDDNTNTQQQAAVSFDGRTLSFDSINNAQSIVHVTESNSLVFRTGLGTGGGLSAGDYVKLVVSKEKLSNLVAIMPAQGIDGRVSFGYRIDGDASVPVRFRDQAYVEVELFYARGPKLSDIINPDKRIAQSSLASNPRAQDYNLAAIPVSRFKEYPPEPGTTHLLLVIDRKDKAVETDNSDNLKALRLPNIVALNPRLKADGSAEIGYKVENPPFVNGEEGKEVTVQAWYSRTPDFAGKIGATPIHRVPMNPSESKNTYVSVPSELLANPPAGAKYLLTRVDNADMVRESIESDNVKPLALPDIIITSVAWDGAGGAVVKLKIVNPENLPAGADLGLSLHWATSSQWADRDGANGTPIVTLPRAAILRSNQEQTIRIAANRLTTHTPQQIERLGLPMTHLLASVDVRNTVAEAGETNNLFALPLPLLSHELSDAPAAATRLERVKLWLQKYRAIIVREAKAWNVDARAIAGVIAWEAAVGPARAVTELSFPLRRWNGPGKVHYRESQVPFGGQSEPNPIVIRELEALGILPKVTDQERARLVATPAGAVRYIAAYMSAYANVYEQYGFNVRQNPGVLATLFNGSGYPNLSAAFNALPSRAPTDKPRPDSDPRFAGLWVQRNMQYLQAAIGTTSVPLFGRIGYVPTTNLSYVTTTGTPLNIPIVELLRQNASELVGVLPNQSPLMPASIAIDGSNVVYTADFVGTESFFFSVRVDGRVVYGGRVTVTVTPPAPTDLVATSEDPKQVRLSWRGPSSAAFYRVERSVGNIWQSVATVPSNESEWNGMDHTPNSQYGFRVTAVALNGLESRPSSVAWLTTRQGTANSPSNLRVLSVSARNVQIRWDDVSGEDFYVVEVSTDVGMSWRLQENVPANHAYEANLTVQAGSSYLFRVIAVNAYGRSLPSNQVAVTTPHLPPGNPTNLRISNRWARMVDLAWDPASGDFSEYRIAISRDGGASWENVGVTAANVTGFRVEDLTPGTRYLFKVRAGNSEGYSEYTNIVDVTTRIEPPAAPTNLRVANVYPRAVDLNWDDQSNNEAEFRIEISRDGGGTWATIGTVSANDTGFRAPNLDPGTRYLFRVLAANSEGVSAYSNTVDVTTRLELPAAPTNLRVANVYPRAVDLNWDDQSNNEAEFRIEISRDGGGTWATIGTVSANDTGFRAPNLDPGTRYLFRVLAANSEGVSAYSNTVDVTTRLELPAAPTNLRVANVYPRAVDLNWDDQSNNEAEFRIEISRDGGGTWATIGTVSANDTGFRAPNLDPGTRYLFRVLAANSEGVSAYSNTVDVTTRLELPAAPTNLRVANVYPRAVDLNWDDQSNNEAEFRIEISRDGGGTWATIGTVSANDTGFRAPNLDPGTRYLFRVLAANSEGVSAYSNTVDVTTRLELPAAPTNLRVANVYPRAVDLNWDDQSNNEAEFRIAVSLDGGASWTNVGTVAANVTSFRVQNLSVNTRYWIRVRAANSEGTTDSNVISVVTLR